MDAAIVEKQTADGWRVALHSDLQEALKYLTLDELQGVIAFAIREYQEDAAIQAAAELKDIREDYRRACREYRSNNFYRVPEWLKDHLWDARQAVKDKALPVEYQYVPLTDAMFGRRMERIADWGSSEYEKVKGW